MVQSGVRVQGMLSAIGRSLRGLGNVGTENPVAPVARMPARALVIAAVASLVYVTLATHLPVGVFANASFDDAWFYLHARTLLAGHWFGRYSQMTLIKGPGYSAFLALNAVLGTPVTLLQALLYLLACALFALGVRRLSRSTGLGLAVFVCTLWQPDLFPVRLMRDDIYPAQTLLFLACLLQALFLSSTTRSRVAWAVGAGLALAWLWLTREEGIWTAPATLVICGVAVWRERGRLREVLTAAGAGVFALAVVATGNLIAYRTFTLVDLKGPFSQALGAVQSVRVGDPTPYVPVPARVRQQLYAESPSFRALRPYFEGVGRYWTGAGCRVYPTSCGDYAGGWFIWALRDAVSSTGRYDSAVDADRYYRTLAREVRTACAAKRLTCVHGVVAFMPGVTGAQWRQVPKELQGLADFLLYRQPRPFISDSSGNPEEIATMWRFSGLPQRAPAESERVRTLVGWFHAPPAEWIQLRCAASGAAALPVGRLPSPDIAVHFNDPAAADSRFRATMPAEGDCRVQLAGAGPSDPGLSFEDLALKRDVVLAGRQLYIDSVGAASPEPAEVLARRMRDLLGAAFRLTAPPLCAAAALGWLVHLVLLWRRKLRLDPYWWLCHALWLLVASRIAILVLVDMSSFPAVNALYLSAAFPLFWAALLLTVGLPLRAKAMGLKPKT